jgi:hypothetical protein
MRALILAAGAALTLSACGAGRDSANSDMNSIAAVDNTMIDQNAALGGMDGNVATNAETENALMMNDLTHNEADTNLANGM